MDGGIVKSAAFLQIILRRDGMALFAGKNFTREEILAYIGDPLQIAGVRSFSYNDGKASGVRGLSVNTGSGVTFTVLPGRGMDVPEMYYRGIPLHFFSGTGITSPAYYEEPGLGWLRGFFAGLLTTCGITNSGAPSKDMGVAYGLHGRISNTDAEDVSVNQGWVGDEYKIEIRGKLREVSAMGENVVLTRVFETELGKRGFTLRDTIENRGFEEQPIMMLYHMNFGFPLLSPNSRVVAPIISSEPRDEEAKRDRGVEECLKFSEPIHGYNEKVFFHRLASDGNGNTFVSLVNSDIGNGETLGVVVRFNTRELPELTEWKMMRKGFYVVGLEPGLVTPLGRGNLRERGKLPFLKGQDSYSIAIDVEVIDSLEEIKKLENEVSSLLEHVQL